MNILGSVACLLTGGTGSMFFLSSIPQWEWHVQSRIPLIVEKSRPFKSAIDVRTPKEHLENIRGVLNPPIADLASLFNVSRQSIYKWLAESACPEADKLEIIETLSRAADMFRNSGVLRAGILLYMKNFQGISLFELIKNKEPIEEQMKLLVTEAQAMEAAYQRSGLARSSTNPTNDWMSSISIPAYREDL